MRSPRARWALVIALCAVIALVVAAGNASGTHELAGASTQALVEPPDGGIDVGELTTTALGSLTTRTLLLSELMSTPPVVADIARLAGVPAGSLAAVTSYLQGIPLAEVGPDLEVRGMQIIRLRAPYQLDIEPDPYLPRLEIYARAPTVAQAEQVANAVVPALADYLRTLAIDHGVSPAHQVQVVQVGAARGSPLSSHGKDEIAALSFLLVFALSMGVVGAARAVLAGWKLESRRRRGRGAELAELERPGARSGEPRPAGATLRARGEHATFSMRRRTAREVAAAVADDWPHTSRILPWMMAAFLVVLWLVPFDSIQLGGSSLPVDLRFDRIVLPVIFLMWALALAAGGRAAPRLRITWVHVVVFAFAGLAAVTFVVNAHYLDQTLQLNRGVKQLALLMAFVIFFVMITSIVRRSEVPAFLRYTLILAVIAGLGTLVEYRFQYNVFYSLAHTLLPGFQVGSPQSGSVDNLGRRLVEGPAEVSLEAVGMFTMALPIALIGVTDATRWKPRILYGLAAVVLIAAAISTERKSGLLGPLAVVLTIAFFRRRQMLRLAPGALVLVGMVKVLVPGAIGGVTSQLNTSELGVNTVSERVARYDAIRPDVWLHLALGQGFGVYSIRVLDNELLDRLIEGGVLGLASYLVMLLSIGFIAFGPIRRREPITSTAGIVAAAAAMGTLLLSFTYDVFGFPHGPYILFSLLGLFAVSLQEPDRDPAPGEPGAIRARGPRRMPGRAAPPPAGIPPGASSPAARERMWN